MARGHNTPAVRARPSCLPFECALKDVEEMGFSSIR